MLKAGKAQLRIRNTGFTITSTDAPPKCQGSWQILHIRKFGGSDAFRFETGMFIAYYYQALMHTQPSINTIVLVMHSTSFRLKKSTKMNFV